MAMRCPKCGNELGQDEAFCGQCGTATMQPGQATEMMQAPASGNLQAPVSPDQSAMRSPASGQQQPTNFYQDATEAMSMPHMPSPAGQTYPIGYPQQNYGSMPVQGNYPSGWQVQGQPLQQGYFTQHPYPSAPPYQPIPGQSYGFGNQPPQVTPPPKKQNTTILIVAIVTLVLALIATAILLTLFVLNRHTGPNAALTPTAVPTTQPTATTAPRPTATPVTPTPVPSPTVAPTATPFAGYAWCGISCSSNGFVVQFPMGWNQGATQDSTGIQFLNPAQQDEYAAFKTPGTTTSTADALVSTDLQTSFASKPGYAPPTGTQSTTIGGVTWVYQSASYQLNSQPEQIEVYATVYQGKGYVIELQAASSQFSTVNTQYFATMIGSFQFYQSTS
jgi:hypothetical protein